MNFLAHVMLSSRDSEELVGNLLGDTPLETFAEQFYRLLEQYEPQLPPRLQQIIPSMIARNWLVSYSKVDAIERSLSRISLRLSRPNALGDRVLVVSNGRIHGAIVEKLR